MTQPEKRKPLTKLEFARLAVEQEGKCGCGCGKKLDFKPRQVWDEHLTPLFSLGSNDLSNRALYRKECAQAKTSGETLDRAKVRRHSGLKPDQPTRRKARGGSSIQGRGFDKAPGWKHNWKTGRMEKVQ